MTHLNIINLKQQTAWRARASSSYTFKRSVASAVLLVHLMDSECPWSGVELLIVNIVTRNDT